MVSEKPLNHSALNTVFNSVYCLLQNCLTGACLGEKSSVYIQQLTLLKVHVYVG